MLPWETGWGEQGGPAEQEFAALWSAIPKVVFSRTLDHVAGNARLAAGSLTEELRRARDGSGGVVSVGGAGLAAELIAADLIDEYRMFINPVVLGGGTPFFPPHGPRLDLEAAWRRKFGRRAYLNYLRDRSSRCAQAPMSPPSRATASRSGNRSGVQAKAGTPSAARAAALSWS